MLHRTMSALDAQENAINSAAAEMRALDRANRWRLATIVLLTLDVAAVTAWVLIAAVRP